MKAALLDRSTLSIPDEHFDSLAQCFSEFYPYPLTEQENVLARCAGIECIFTNKVVFTKEILQSLPRLKYIGILATGTNNVDVEFARSQGITVQNTEGYSSPSVVQHTWGLILNLATQQPKYFHEKNLWPKSSTFCRLKHSITEVHGKKLGIIGYGAIGEKVAQVATAFGMEAFILESLSGTPQPNRHPLEELLQECDFISVHCPLTPESKGLIDKDFLKKMRKSAFLINTARGPIINEADLAQALKEKWIAGAALDVVCEEPPKATSPLFAEPLSNLYITPHNAWASQESQVRLMEIATENLKTYLRG